MEFEWEKISHDQAWQAYLWRLKVFGGWVLRRCLFQRGNYFESMVFIPDPKHKWKLKNGKKKT